MQCPWCDKTLRFALDPEGLFVNARAGDVGICTHCTQLITFTLAEGIVRTTDAMFRDLQRDRPEYAADLADAQAHLRTIDRRAS